ncbi:hypothetical protein WSM22_20200 [Cytophagales bacterium WSM2-2]|nr:hypothetical protein WSM22_20200 [Cytophagales bacterium WSM2-2]
MKLNVTHCFFVFVLVCGTLSSCTWDEVKPKKVVVPDSVKFNLNIIPIFNANCAKSGCHIKGGQAPDLSAQNAYTSLIYFGYVDLDFPESSILYQKINTGSMKDKATDADRALILEWIKQGALDN